MSEEPIVRLQSGLQFLLTMLPIIVLEGVEEQFPALTVIMVTAMCLCAYKRVI